jgi:hypothetical protein
VPSALASLNIFFSTLFQDGSVPKCFPCFPRGRTSGDSPWPEGVLVLDLEQGSRVKSVIEEAVEGGKAAADVVEEVMGKRHLVDEWW